MADAKLELARFKAFKADNSSTPLFEVPVHFNPASLQYTVTNTLKEEGKGDDKKQFVTQSAAKLTMDLVFDTTDTGEDVRKYTNQMAKLLKPLNEGKDKKVPPTVEFDWGLYSFKGIVEQYKETLDFFAASGVPLRSSVNLTLSRLKAVFESNTSGTADGFGQGLTPTTVLPQPGGPSGGPAGLASALGDPRAARAIAALNGSASLRFGDGGELALNAGVNLQAAAAFSVEGGIGGGASAGLGIGGGMGGGIGISGGIGGGIGMGGGIGGSVGFGVSASAGAGLSLSGGIQASSSADAFEGLRSGIEASVSMPDGRELLTGSFGGGTSTGTQFGFGGQAQVQGSASLSANVGADADLNSRISFS